MRIDDLDLHRAAQARWRAYLASPEGRAALRRCRRDWIMDCTLTALSWALLLLGVAALGWMVMAW